jgi:hypothetical protein
MVIMAINSAEPGRQGGVRGVNQDPTFEFL